jgi:hypothetical protein
VYIEPPLHSWDEAYLVMVNDLFDVLLNLVCIVLLRIFASMFIKEIGLLFGDVFAWFWDEYNTGFIKCIRQFSFHFYFLEQFKEGWY